MNGRDVIKFILRNSLLDKSIMLSEGSIVAIDHLPTDEEFRYVLQQDGKYKVALQSGSDLYLLENQLVSDISLDHLETLDKIVSTEPSNNISYKMSFSDWINSISDEGSALHAVVEYNSYDPQFSANCTSFNQLITYLENQNVSEDVLQSAETAWIQYLRECRKHD